MNLLRILGQFNLVLARIDALAQNENASTADLSLLIRQANSLRQTIVDSVPETKAEAQEKVACLLHLVKRDAMQHGFDVEISALLDAASDACNRFQISDGEAVETPVSKAPDMSPRRDRAGSVFGGSIADYVSFAPGRVSLIDTGYRYLATSQTNAEFYQLNQVGVMGKHVADLIGEFRFETRAKHRLDTCFGGEAQSYHHALPSADSARIFRCDMQPVNSFDGTILGALVYMTDVTEQVRRLRPTDAQFAQKIKHH